jgi:Zn2+/Cd2+-exporting ATPase
VTPHTAEGSSTRLALPILLPDVPDLQDECVARLVHMLEREGGVERVHIERDAHADGIATAHLCLHYDRDRLTLAGITDIAKTAGAKLTDRYAHTLLSFRAVGSEDNGQRMEAGLRDLHGVTAASVNYAGQVARIEFDRQLTTLAAVQERLQALGARPPAGANWYSRNRELAWSLIAGALLVAGFAGEHLFGLPRTVAIGLYAVSYAFGARDNVAHFLKDVAKGHFHFNIDLLMVVAAIGAAILGEWAEGALLLFMFSLAHALEHYALGRARQAISALAELAPTRATVIVTANGARVERDVPIESVKPRDLVLVKPSERIPVDGTVSEGRSSVNQAPITGESIPVGKSHGDQVFAGSVNGDGALVVETTAAVGDRTLDRVITLVAEAETQKAPTQQFTEKFERIFVPLVLVADVLVIVLPPLLGIWTWSESFYRGMAMLVGASPCALALGTPATVLAGIAQAARKGVLIKGGVHLEALGAIEILALDKTGTITTGEPVVTDVVPEPGVGADELLRITAAAERQSQHPVARAILAAAATRALTVPEAGATESVTGRGILSMVEGQRARVGRLLMFDESEKASDTVPSSVRDTISRLEREGRTTMLVKHGERWLGVLAIADEPREGVRATLDALRAAGIRRIVMLTGDNAGVGKAVGDRVGIDDVRAGLLPEDKAAAIKSLLELGPVAMIGDGVNDAPALAHATVGIAMGGAGTAAALETADVALMGDDLARLPFAIGLSRQARRTIKQNLFIALGVIALLVIVTITGIVGIGPAVILHEGSTLVVIANALRLLRYAEPAHRATGL